MARQWAIQALPTVIPTIPASTLYLTLKDGWSTIAARGNHCY
jgi:hypothetical protein